MSGLPRQADEQARSLLLLLLGGALFGLLLAGAGGVARLRAGEPAGPGIPADVPLPPPPAYPPGSGLATSVGTAVLEEVDLEREVREEQVALLGRIGAQDVEVEAADCLSAVLAQVGQAVLVATYLKQVGVWPVGDLTRGDTRLIATGVLPATLGDVLLPPGFLLPQPSP